MEARQRQSMGLCKIYAKLSNMLSEMRSDSLIGVHEQERTLGEGIKSLKMELILGTRAPSWDMNTVAAQETLMQTFLSP